MPAPVRYIDTTTELEEIVRICMGRPVVSLDTEFARFNTYYPVVGLVQIFDGEICYLIDPLTIESMAPLADLLLAEGTIKVFHACSEDMEVFQHAIGAVPSPVIDSQIAAAMLGAGFSMSYQNLVGHYLSVDIPKEETRSDWLQRPLTEGQLQYAALDVIYLLRVYEKQHALLVAHGREQWVIDECRSLSSDLATMADPDTMYLKMKGISRLNRKQLSVLKALCAWREISARKADVPRNRIVDQKSLMHIAAGELTSKQELQSVAGMSPRQVRKYGDDLLFLAVEARRLPEHQLPMPVSRDHVRVDSKKLDNLRKHVQRRAGELQIAPELLCKRRHLEELLRSVDARGRYRLPAGLDGWRREVIGEELLAILGEPPAATVRACEPGEV